MPLLLYPNRTRSLAATSRARSRGSPTSAQKEGDLAGRQGWRPGLCRLAAGRVQQRPPHQPEAATAGKEMEAETEVEVQTPAQDRVSEREMEE